jgi:GT2 family glycosyltransferase
MEGQSVKVVLVDNNSIEAETHQHLPLWQARLKDRGFGCDILEDASPFNFSQLNNKAVNLCSGLFQPDLLLFLNNDIEFTEPQQLRNWCLWHRALENVGVSGATLLYPNRTVQHACVLPGFKIVATHPLRGASEPIATEWSRVARCVPAVTGAALMVENQIFQQLGGFDEHLAHACQDVDLCLKARKAGFENWVTPELKLLHHESATRKSTHKPNEVLYFYERWERELESLCNVSKKLSRWTESPALARGEGSFPWRLFL